MSRYEKVCVETANEETAALRSGHSTKSAVLHKHYDYSSKGGRGISLGPAALSKSKGFGLLQLKEMEIALARGGMSGNNAGKGEENKSKEGDKKKSKRNRKAAASKDYDSMASVSSKR